MIKGHTRFVLLAVGRPHMGDSTCPQRRRSCFAFYVLATNENRPVQHYTVLNRQRADQEKSKQQKVGTTIGSTISVAGLVIPMHRFGAIVLLLLCLYGRRTGRNDGLLPLSPCVQHINDANQLEKCANVQNVLANESHSTWNTPQAPSNC